VVSGFRQDIFDHAARPFPGALTFGFIAKAFIPCLCFGFSPQPFVR